MRHYLQHILLLLLTLVGTLRLSAQPMLAKPEMYIGIHGGALGSMYTFTPRINGTEHFLDAAFLSWNGGVVFRYSGHKCCGLQVELNYMQKGWRENAEREYTVHYTRKLDYIELPFLTHVYFGKPSFRAFINLGPQIGYCFHEAEDGTRNSSNPSAPQYNMPIDNAFDWGIAGGVGFYYRHLKAGVFQLEARFNYSLGDTFSHSKTAFFSQSHAMNVSLNLGYLLPIHTSQHTKNNIK